MNVAERAGAARVFQPELVVSPDVETMSRQALRRILDVITQKPDALICLATGASPARTYALLVEEGRRQPELLQKVRWLKLDEWAGLSPDHPGSSERYLWERLLGPLQVRPEQYFGWNGQATDPAAECQRMAAWLARHGPMDLCILGLGKNGHLAMNEPAAALQPGPHLARLTPETQQHPMLAETGARVMNGFTLGMADLLASRRILLLVCGEGKASVLARLWREPVITTAFPASFLWLHPRVTICCDRAAAAELD
ncbi:MAG: 6-phosphogluconolactonase [Limisphaera sp.]|nr:6-phosphogluconolactonase [Limisphaera sp.]